MKFGSGGGHRGGIGTFWILAIILERLPLADPDFEFYQSTAIFLWSILGQTNAIF